MNDHLAEGINFPGWRKGIYPIRQDALAGIGQASLYVAKYNSKIVGSIILNHVPEVAYHKAKWEYEYDYSDVFVIHTFVVHPDFWKCGIGKALIDFSIQQGIESRIKSIRLDVYEGNIPAIRLYEKCGFKYVDTVDLGLGNYGLDWFRLYEKALI